MFKILQQTITTGIATVAYPYVPAVVSAHFRGRPEFDFATWRDARPAADVCPTGAIMVGQALPPANLVSQALPPANLVSHELPPANLVGQALPPANSRRVTVDYGLCVFCGQCADVSPDGAVRVTTGFELATHSRASLILTADYTLNPDGTHRQLMAVHQSEATAGDWGGKVGEAIRETLGRSLAIRQVDAGSCNGCEMEIAALNNPIHDIERFGIHFVASPRHADMLLVTGPVTRNMELALEKTCAATPDPKVIVAVGACGISGGIFGTNYASRGGVDATIPVDVYIPGCPPRPEALLYGILLAVGRLAERAR
jgi:Ni,Fe-hydrogenase III small subunit/formate hydrogenlyase subunit 6/NADH:ubiquinone oxidoreductase subunit I